MRKTFLYLLLISSTTGFAQKVGKPDAYAKTITADDLKRQVGGERLEVTVSEGSPIDAAERVLRAFGEGGRCWPIPRSGGSPSA